VIPQAIPAEGVPEQERSVAHPAEARKARHDRPEEGGPPTKKDRRPAMTTQAVLRLVELSLVFLEHTQLQDTRSDVPTPDLVANGVPEDCTDHDDDNQGDDVQMALTGQETTEQDGRLTGDDEPEEERRFAENQ
jgi:hypothetical protein